MKKLAAQAFSSATAIPPIFLIERFAQRGSQQKHRSHKPQNAHK
jgi:hypothetical protein